MEDSERDTLLVILDEYGPKEVLKAVVEWAVEEGSKQDELANRLAELIGNFGYW